MAQQSWILRFGELGLKSKVVRRGFQRSLRKNLVQLAENSSVPLIRDRLRNFDVIYSSAPTETVEDLMCHGLGIVAIDRMVELSSNLDPQHISQLLLERHNRVGEKRTFGVRIKRLGEKGEWDSQSYARALGSALIERDPSLSVDLSNPEWWVKIILEPASVSSIEKRIQGPGGLPTGVQGDVLAQLRTEDDVMSSFLIMRRGSRIIPILESKSEFIELLSKWDPFLGVRSRTRDERGEMFQRPAWGVVGLTIEQAKPHIQRRETAIKTTPLSTLEPLCGWTEDEKQALWRHVKAPSQYLPHPDKASWIE
ncbi:MAG: hypothetical protein HOB47_05440 [Euryarchaeota archaeon]|jgi:adenylyl- and sulfurtransferase ThiI|nr:hypothetical protein [Euryarchaeota archaeon]MBT6641006.1 hypothetical protein [Euryarchaeota archaeon]MBT7263108.1 hypothetical protein [Euryarchaeota archaeon]